LLYGTEDPGARGVVVFSEEMQDGGVGSFQGRAQASLLQGVLAIGVKSPEQEVDKRLAGGSSGFGDGSLKREGNVGWEEEEKARLRVVMDWVVEVEELAAFLGNRDPLLVIEGGASGEIEGDGVRISWAGAQVDPPSGLEMALELGLLRPGIAVLGVHVGEVLAYQVPVGEVFHGSVPQYEGSLKAVSAGTAGLVVLEHVELAGTRGNPVGEEGKLARHRGEGMNHFEAIDPADTAGYPAQAGPGDQSPAHPLFKRILKAPLVHGGGLYLEGNLYRGARVGSF
jgi:hypothetical protein